MICILHELISIYNHINTIIYVVYNPPIMTHLDPSVVWSYQVGASSKVFNSGSALKVLWVKSLHKEMADDGCLMKTEVKCLSNKHKQTYVYILYIIIYVLHLHTYVIIMYFECIDKYKHVKTGPGGHESGDLATGTQDSQQLIEDQQVKSNQHATRARVNLLR